MLSAANAAVSCRGERMRASGQLHCFVRRRQLESGLHESPMTEHASLSHPAYCVLSAG
jgi:hypothetical protein